MGLRACLWAGGRRGAQGQASPQSLGKALGLPAGPLLSRGAAVGMVCRPLSSASPVTGGGGCCVTVTRSGLWKGPQSGVASLLGKHEKQTRGMGQERSPRHGCGACRLFLRVRVVQSERVAPRSSRAVVSRERGTAARAARALSVGKTRAP